MRKLVVFNSITLDGYFAGQNDDISWAHREPDPEWNAFVDDNAKSGGVLVFGRRTYELMVSYWPTPLAARNDPIVAERMNRLPKIVFSRTLPGVSWSNTTLVKGNLAAEIRKLKQESGDGMTILGSGSIASQLAQEGLIDEYLFVVVPVAIGKGRTMFDGITSRLTMKPTRSRTFGNGNVLLCYEPAA